MTVLGWLRLGLQSGFGFAGGVGFWFAYMVGCDFGFGV